VAKAVFFISAFILLYTYALYPLWMWLFWRQLNQSASGDSEPSRWPSVSVIVGCYNEESFIADKIANFLGNDYPGDSELLVVSDGSTDRTAEIAKSVKNNRVRVFARWPRRGKGAAVNFAAGEARGELLIFTDANAFFAKDALRELALPFADPNVGVVTGVSRYPEETIGSVYQRYEAVLKSLEARRGIIATADGAIYALRGCLWRSYDDGLIHEFLHPIQAAIQGATSLIASNAVCIEHFSVENEFARQSRMVSQAALVLFRFLPVLVCSRCWNMVFVLISHKLLRWLTLPILTLFVVATSWLASQGGIYLIALWTQGLFGALAVCGSVAERLGMAQKAAAAYQFVRLNSAALLGLCLYLLGRVPVTWQPRGR